MIDHIEVMRQLTLVAPFAMPIIKGRNNPEISVSIEETRPIPEGWLPTSSPRGYYPEGTKRIVLRY